MRRTATAPAASASSTHPRMSQPLRAIVAHARRGSISGAGSARTGSGRASMGWVGRGSLLLLDQVVDRDQRRHELHELVRGADVHLVANGKRRILHVQLVARADAQVADAIGDGDFTRGLSGPNDVDLRVATGLDGAT